MAELDTAIAIVRDVVPRLSEQQLGAEFPEPLMGKQLRTGLFLMHLCAHAGFHLGQAGYVRRALTGDVRTSGPLPLQALAEPENL